MLSKRILYLFSLLTFLWLIVVLGGYYLYHKPFTSHQLLHWLKLGYQLLIAFLIVVSSGGIGLCLLTRYKEEPEPSVLQSVGLGLGILATIFFLVSWAIGIRWYLSLGLLFGLLIGLRRWNSHWMKCSLVLIQNIVPKGRFTKCLALLIGFLLLAGLMIAISPPLAFDSLTYHLSLPLSYVQKGNFEYIPENAFWGMPQLGEMLYTLALNLAGIEAAALLGWMIGVLALIGVGEIIIHFLAHDDVWIAFAALLSGLTFSVSLGWGYVDWFAFFWGVCVVFTLKDWITRPSRHDIILAGVYSGFALGTKYTAGILFLAVLLIVFFFRWHLSDNCNRQPWRMVLFDLLNLSISCLVTSSPWWVKNLLAVRQPIYPLLFSAGEMSPLRIRFYTGVEPFGNWLTSVFLPITATMLGIEGKEGFNASIGPLFLILAPFSVVYLFREREDLGKGLVWLCLIIALIGWVVWGVGSRLAGYLIQSRLYWAIFPSYVVLSAFGWRVLCSLRLANIRFRFVLQGLVLFILLLSNLEVFSVILQRRVLDWATGIIDTPTYLVHNLGWYYPATQQIREASQPKGTLMLFEPRNLYCLPNCDGDELLDEWFLASVDPTANSEKIFLNWKKRGYQTVLIFHKGAQFVRQTDKRYQANQWKLFEQTTSLLPIEQSFGDAYILYRIP